MVDNGNMYQTIDLNNEENNEEHDTVSQVD
jgi:hypothetical protein